MSFFILFNRVKISIIHVAKYNDNLKLSKPEKIKIEFCLYKVEGISIST